jgi:hypothetical protein
MIRAFLGYDHREVVAYQVACHSIQSRASQPVTIAPVMLAQLKGVFTRERNSLQSADFSFSRFLVPWMCGFEGWALFADCDILCLAELWALRDERFAVMCVHHDHRPTGETKFLGEKQTQYEKKNWSSLMRMNCPKCSALTPEYVNTKPGLELHRSRWLENENLIGEIPHKWNHLVDYDPPAPEGELGIIHYTEGGPYFADYRTCGYADLWRREFRSMQTPPQPADG